MAKKIITSGRVHLEHDGGVITLRPGDEVPAWAEKIVTNPALFQGQPAPEPKAEPKPVAKAEPKAEPKKTTRRKKAVKKDDTPDEPETDQSRESLIAALTEKGIEFDDDNTDDELALILENAE